jgi:putative ABC transport system substrate-binding protein
MKRRASLTLLAAAPLAVPVAIAQGQAAVRKPRLVGFLGLYSAQIYARFLNAFREGLRALGHREGTDLVIEYRWAEGVEERLPELARQLVALQPDLIVTHTGAGIRAAQAATSTIPIVMGVSADPVGVGHIASLARPGGNTTGVSSQVVDLASKRLELLKQAVPQARHFAVLSDRTNPAARLGERELQAAARALGVTVQSFGVDTTPATLDPAFATIVHERIGGIVVEPYPVVTGHVARIVAFAATHRLPTIGGVRQFTEDGGLLAYGGDFVEGWRLAASYVHKILNGAKPAELPVEQPTKFELTINLKTARSLGLVIPQSLLVRADAVIR